MVSVRTKEELAKAIKDDEIEISILGPLGKEIAKIRGKGKVAWGLALGAIAVAVAGALVAAPSAGTSALVSVAAAPVAVGILGASATATAIGVAIAAGGVGALNKLRAYRQVSFSDSALVLRRR